MNTGDMRLVGLVRGIVASMSASAVVALGTLIGGCAESPPPAAESADTTSHEPTSRKSGPQVESEIGALDDTKVKQVFEHLAPKLSSCFSVGTSDVAFLGGDVRFAVRVTASGSARWVYVKDSTLGSRKTEACMTAALKSATWPRPEGGEGLAENTFSFEPGSEERPPVAWTPDRLGPQQRKVKAALEQCRKKSGTKSLKATMYVDTDGKATSVGVASGDEKGDQATDCVTSALQDLKYPSPGSYAAKVTVTTD